MKAKVYSEELINKKPFRISRGASNSYDRVFVELNWDGIKGIGEAACSSFYGENPDTVRAALSKYTSSLPDDPFVRDEQYTIWNSMLRRNHSARAALDTALLDIAGQATGLPLFAYLGLSRPYKRLTSITLSLDKPEIMAKDAEKNGADCIKVKMGGDGYDMERLAAIRVACPESILRIDANCSWTVQETVELSPHLQSLGVEMVEQPVPPGDNDALAWIRNRINIPLFADESVETSSDIRNLVGAVDGINIKLSKCGGPTEALKMIHIARGLGLKIMLGCMVESSVGIAAAAHLSSAVDYLDLDGHLFLSNDPWQGIEISKGGYITLSGEAGLGLKRKKIRKATAKMKAKK